MGSAPSFSRAATAMRPFSQVHMAVKITTASARGTQPPCTNFTMLADIRVASITMKLPSTRIDNGQLHFEGVYVKGKRDGHWNEFHPKGHKWREGTFRMGEKIGTWTTWDRQGGNPTTEQFPP